jgi:hypothetical protein
MRYHGLVHSAGLQMAALYALMDSWKVVENPTAQVRL